jgi:hypothetical protein
MTNPLTYDDIKALAVELGRPTSTLIVLAPANDPFYCGPARQRLADWFATAIWPLVDPEAESVHVRRIHYLIVNQPPELRPLKVDGTAFENTEVDWVELSRASLAARELGLVDVNLFVDRRAGEPTFVFLPNDTESEAEVVVTGTDFEQPPPERAPRYIPWSYDFPGLPTLTVFGPEIVEPYCIEVWTEKSTMNDILDPLARRLGVTLVTGVGELSHTHCNRVVNRALAHGRKTRILYISDFDPGGDGMPVSIARKIEHILRRDGHDLDIRLDPLLLTAEQVEHYDLPRIPIKDSDARKEHFEARHGTGAVELDALEAIHPGEFARIVEDAVAVYREPTRATRREIENVAEQLEWYAVQTSEEVLQRHGSTLAHLRAEFARMQQVIRPHQDALRALALDYERRIAEHVEAINSQVEAFYDHAEPVISEIADDLEESKPDPDDIEWPGDPIADESRDQLYQSERGYLEQVARYKRHQGKPIERRRRNGNGRSVS